ncbi:MAG: imidazolonepropionase [Anaerolineae bacterium]|nr:imidazolonepropionase [Anaerolineae bacterium]
MNVDLLILNAAQLVTCASGGRPKRGAQMRDLGIIAGGAVAVKDGLILDVGATADIRARYESAQVIDAGGRVVCPGFVDCHTHVVYAGDRLDDFESRILGKTYMEILAAGGGIMSTARATRAASADELYALAAGRLDVMLHNGTTTAEIKTGYGLDIATERKLFDVIARLDREHAMTIRPTFLGAHAVPPEFASANAYADHVIHEMMPAIFAAYEQSNFAAEGVPLAVDVFCEDGVFDTVLTGQILSAAKERWRQPVKAHVDEFVNLGGVRVALELGALSVDHLDVTPDAELELLAQSETVGVFLPAVNFNLGSTHYGHARKLIDAGGVLALATDLNPGSAPTPSLPLVMAIACRYQKLLPAEALNAITINAAAALQLEGVVGSIEPGKQADFTILATDDYRALAYEFGALLVEKVIIKGEMQWNASF